MSVCSKCHTENLEGTEVCANCGASLAQPPDLVSRPRPAQRTSGLAIASLFLGVLGFSPFLALLFDSAARSRGVDVDFLLLFFLLDSGAFILSIIALVQIGKEQGAFRGRWMAISGMTCAILFPAIFVILFPLFFQREESSHRHLNCTSNQRQIALAINMYCTENEDTMPGKAGLTPESPNVDKQQWRTVDIQGVADGVFDCKYSKLSGAPGPDTADYAMNADIMGTGLGQIPVPIATLLTADTKGTDAIFSAKDIDQRHNGGFCASFVDGHVASYNASDIPHDPEVNPTGLGMPSTNKFLIQGATNVIEVKFTGREWDNPVIFAYTGNKLTTSIKGKSERGACISAYFSLVPPGKVVPKDLTIGTFVNGPNAAPSPITLPVPTGIRSAADMTGIYYTFRLPPVIGKKHAFYTMTGGDADSVRVAPGNASVP